MAMSAWRGSSWPSLCFSSFWRKGCPGCNKRTEKYINLYQTGRANWQSTDWLLPPLSLHALPQFPLVFLTLVLTHSPQTGTGDERGNVWTHLVQLNVGITFSLSKKHVENFKHQAGYCELMPPHLHFLALSHRVGINCHQVCLPQTPL